MLRTVHLPISETGHAATGFAHDHADHCGCRAAALHFGGVPAAVWADRNVARDPASDSSHHRRSRGPRTLAAQATNARVIRCGGILAARNSVPALGPGRNPALAARDAEQALGRIPCGPSVQEPRDSASRASAGRITALSHSPTDIPERRAASRAAARASGRRPLRFHGPPDFILAPKLMPEKLMCPLSRSSRNSNAEVNPYCSETGLFRITVNNRLRNRAAGHRSFTGYGFSAALAAARR